MLGIHAGVDAHPELARHGLRVTAGLLVYAPLANNEPGRPQRNYHPVRCGQVTHLADVQLFTSIPPRISRTNAAGDEIGESYQADCVASWMDAGFAPATINARSE